MSENEKVQDRHESKLIDIAREYINLDNCFGMKSNEVDQMKNILDNVVANQPSNKFPDFVAKDSLVEIFSVTSSKEFKGHGSEHLRKSNNFRKTNKKYLEKGNSFNNDLWYGEHCHEYLKRSFNKNISKHLNSLDKFMTTNTNSSTKSKVFFIDYSDMYTLSMLTYFVKNNDKGLLMGDFPSNSKEIIGHYRLSRDIEVLNELKKYSDKIDYIIFFNYLTIEFIKLNRIDDLLNLIDVNQWVTANEVVETTSFHKINMNF